jgi:hypothetical protein
VSGCFVLTPETNALEPRCQAPHDSHLELFDQGKAAEVRRFVFGGVTLAKARAGGPSREHAERTSAQERARGASAENESTHLRRPPAKRS